MTDIAVTPPREGAPTALFKHARYIIGENPVTGFAFALFVPVSYTHLGAAKPPSLRADRSGRCEGTLARDENRLTNSDSI